MVSIEFSVGYGSELSPELIESVSVSIIPL